MVLSPYRAMIVLSHVMMIIPQNDALMTCKNTNASSVTIHLSCNSSQWIHVRSETYGNTTLEQGCLNTTKSCTKTLMTDTDGLIVNCNGKQTCSELLQHPTTCIPVRSYKIKYDCVEESLDVCSSEEKSTNGVIYLHSSGFPGSNGIDDSCTCGITGTLMSIQLIEHLGNKEDLNISTDGDNLEQGVTPVNRDIVQRANHITLNYQGMEDGRFWIKVTGSGMVYVKCSNESNNILSTSMATTAPPTTKESSSTASSTVPASTITQSVTSTESICDTETPRTDDPNSTAVEGGVCGIIILIVIIDISLLVYFKVIKPSRGEGINTAHADMLNLDTNTSDSPHGPVTKSTLDTSAPGSDEQRSCGANNTYSGLSQYENQDEQHEYGKIHVYGNTRV